MVDRMKIFMPTNTSVSNKYHMYLESFFMGWLAGIGPATPVPQTGVLPLNYSHHVPSIRQHHRICIKLTLYSFIADLL